MLWAMPHISMFCRLGMPGTQLPIGGDTSSITGSKRATRLPRMLGFQAAGAAPIYYDRVIEKPETAASAIRIGNPASWNMAKAAFKESGGAN